MFQIKFHQFPSLCNLVEWAIHWDEFVPFASFSYQGARFCSSSACASAWSLVHLEHVLVIYESFKVNRLSFWQLEEALDWDCRLLLKWECLLLASVPQLHRTPQLPLIGMSCACARAGVPLIWQTRLFVHWCALSLQLANHFQITGWPVPVCLFDLPRSRHIIHTLSLFNLLASSIAIAFFLYLCLKLKLTRGPLHSLPPLLPMWMFKLCKLYNIRQWNGLSIKYRVPQIVSLAVQLPINSEKNDDEIQLKWRIRSRLWERLASAACLVSSFVLWSLYGHADDRLSIC